MLAVITDKRTEGGYVSESVYLKSKQWDFGQKKAPSQYMAAEARILLQSWATPPVMHRITTKRDTYPVGTTLIADRIRHVWNTVS